MARSDNYIGLNDWATKTVLKKAKARIRGVMEFTDGRKRRFTRWAKVPVAKVRVIGIIKGVWIPRVADLKEYAMPDGTVYQEYVQAEPWHGGPCYYIALKNAKTGKPVTESLWTSEETGMF